MPSALSSSRAASVVIPTFGRDEVLLETVRRVLALQPPPAETLVVDQSVDHAPPVAAQLARLDDAGQIRWIRLPAPSIPAAMNRGLLLARNPIVIFLDDDVIPCPRLIAAHLEAQEISCIVAGQVLQPGEEAAPLADAPRRPFRFTSSTRGPIDDLMGGNFSIDRDLAIRIGGFDENFVAAAYRFEAELAARAGRSGASILFEPRASIRHLRAPMGGTRSHGDHLRTAKPGHAVGRYYYLLAVRPPSWVLAIVTGLLASVRTRHHLRRPWFIPVTLLAELRGLVAALRLHARGPRLLTVEPAEGPSPATLGGAASP